MTLHPRSIVVLAGPNGAGKSTIAPSLLHGELHVTEFINADVIASGLSAFAPERAAFAAGPVMLARARELAGHDESFALETTLASRSLAPWITTLIEGGYKFHLVFLWLPDASAAVARVTQRVSGGGHHVPEATVRRRYESGLVNFFELYRPLTTSWRLMNNSRIEAPSMVAFGRGLGIDECADVALWDTLVSRYSCG